TAAGELVERVPAVEAARLPARPRHVKLVQDALVAVVQGERGTARGARVPGVTVAGKTGTAQVVALRRDGEDHSRDWRFKDHAWFVAYAPAEAPELAVAVLVEHGGGGGAVAAPVAQRVL